VLDAPCFINERKRMKKTCVSRLSDVEGIAKFKVLIL
jgi:hypothetical protein